MNFMSHSCSGFFYGKIHWILLFFVLNVMGVQVGYAQDRAVLVSGHVYDQTDAALMGVTIMVKGTSTGVVSDLDGNFSLTVPSSKSVLVFKYVGYIPQEITVGNRKELKVKLIEDTKNLEEVVVVGYGTSKAKDITGSVSTISAKDIQKINTTNVSSLMQNLASGVLVAQNTGKPGETVRVRVRGATSLSGSNEPLYVIDGLPVDDPSALDILSPSDIQSMDVLKDASASAIYGSRAANGVVIITTRKGVAGKKPTLNVNYNATVDTQIKNFRILYGDEWRDKVRQFARETLVHDPSNVTAGEILKEGSDYLGTANTNWFNEVKQPAWRHNADVSISGGGAQNRYFVSFSVLDQKGMVIGDDLTRYNARVNLDVDVLPILRFGTNVTMSYSDKNASGTSMFSAQGFRPDLDIYDKDGNYLMMNTSSNPVANTHKKDNTDSYRLFATAWGEVDIYKGLKFKSSLSVSQDFTFRETFSPSFLSSNNKASGSEYNYHAYKTVFDNVFSYNTKLGDSHVIDAIAGASFENFEGKSTSINGSNYAQDEIFTNIGSASEITAKNISNGYNAKGLASFFVRANYRFADRYLFTFTSRYDGSSMFGTKNRYGFFPSGAFAWRVSQEEFMRGATWIDDLKLKLSAGTTGIQNLSSFSNRDLYSSSSYMDLPALVHTQIANREIRWEKSTLYDAGIDFSFFNQRFRGTLGGYIKNTKDLIWGFNFPSSTAGGSMNRNVGSVTNKGIEVSLTYAIFQEKDLNWDLTLNLAHNKNKVTYLVSEGSVENAMGINIHGSNTQVLAQGYPMGSFFGWKDNGIIQTKARVKELDAYAKEHGADYYDGSKLRPGMLEYQDANKDGKIDDNDRVLLGSPDPKVFGGLVSSFSYKGFSVFTSFGFQIGGLKAYGKTLQNMPAQLTGLVDYGLNDRWSESNRDAKYPALYIEDGSPRMNQMQLHNASYLRLQELRLSYDLPRVAGIRVQLFTAASNLFTLTKYPGTDPATVNGGIYGGNHDSSYPGIRSFSFGLKLNL
ncbi:MAG: TonB-dependent receptor [Bacteroidales bacterium]